jgi:hypothetical protein
MRRCCGKGFYLRHGFLFPLFASFISCATPAKTPEVFVPLSPKLVSPTQEVAGLVCPPLFPLFDSLRPRAKTSWEGEFKKVVAEAATRLRDPTPLVKTLPLEFARLAPELQKLEDVSALALYFAVLPAQAKGASLFTWETRVGLSEKGLTDENAQVTLTRLGHGGLLQGSCLLPWNGNEAQKQDQRSAQEILQDLLNQTAHFSPRLFARLQILAAEPTAIDPYVENSESEKTRERIVTTASLLRKKCLDKKLQLDVSLEHFALGAHGLPELGRGCDDVSLSGLPSPGPESVSLGFVSSDLQDAREIEFDRNMRRILNKNARTRKGITATGGNGGTQLSARGCTVAAAVAIARLSPDKNSEIVGRLLKGQKVKVTNATEPGWFSMEWDGKTVYLHRSTLGRCRS